MTGPEFNRQAKLVGRLRAKRLLAVALIALAFPLLIALAILDLHYKWAIFAMTLWEIPALFYGVVVLTSKCPRCGGPFFYRDDPSGFRLRWGRNCQNCGFPER